MRADNFPYCIPDCRSLTAGESRLLGKLLEQTDGVDVSVHDLRVVARCGCGKCPTILLGKSENDVPVTSNDSNVVKEWSGRATNGTLVGVLLFAKDGLPTELEAYSVDGGPVEDWPSIDALKPWSG